MRPQMCCDTTVLQNHSCKHTWAAVPVTPTKNTAYHQGLITLYDFIHSFQEFVFFRGLHTLWWVVLLPHIITSDLNELSRMEVDYDGETCLCYVKVLHVQMCCLEAESASITDLKVDRRWSKDGQ